MFLDTQHSVAMSVCMISLILAVVAIATPYWATGSGSGLETNAGLWKNCIKGNTGKVCLDTPEDGALMYPKNALYTVRVFALLSVVSLAMSMYCLTQGYPYQKCASSWMMAGGVSMLIACVVWGSELMKIKMSGKSSIDAHVGYSLALAIVAGILPVGMGVGHWMLGQPVLGVPSGFF